MTAVAPTVTSNPFASAVIGLPGLLGGLIAGPPDVISGFTRAASIPEGTNIPRTFGIRSPQALGGLSGIPIANPFEFTLGSGASLLGRADARAGFFAQGEPGGSGQAIAFTSEALSFTPRIAERGEARIQAFLDTPVPVRRRRAGSVLEPFFDRFLNVAQDEQALFRRNRTREIEAARKTSAEMASSNPFFRAVASAFTAGRLEGGVASPATIEAFGQPSTTAFAPLPQLLQQPFADTARADILARLTALESPAGSPSTPAIRQPVSTQEVSSMATVPTTGLGGFFGGLVDVLQASTPLLSAILPPLISRGQPQQFLGGGPALPAGQIPGFFPDPRTGTFPATQAMAQFPGQFNFLSPGVAGPQQAGILPTITATQGACPPRLPARIDVPLPPTPGGAPRFVTYKNMGMPVLFRGDLAACKRVRRVGRMVRKAAGGR